MSYARGFGLNGKSYYMNICQPFEVVCNFIVDSANGNGLGIRSLKSNGYIENVFMHTSSTPGSNNGHLNPNPASGYIYVNFKNNFNYYLGGFSGQVIAPGNTSTSSVTAGSIYQITSLGTATLAQWQAKGFPVGFTPAVNAAFVATANGSIGGSATVGTPGVPSVELLTVVGDANQTISNSNLAANAGAQLIVACWAATNSSTTTLVASAPADNTVIAMSFMFDRSSVTIDGL
jgi:hypothetical protein